MTMATSAKDLILESNNFGVRMFETGLLEQARLHFEHAMDSLDMLAKQESRFSSHRNDSNNNGFDNNSSDLYSVFDVTCDDDPIRGWSRPLEFTRSQQRQGQGQGQEQQQQQQQQFNESHSRCQEPSTEADSLLFVLSRCIEIVPRFQQRFVSVYVMSIAYNLAVTYHQLALRNPTDRCFHNASRFYEASMEILEGSTSISRILGSKPSNLADLEIAIINNAGHIYYNHLANFAAATQCYHAVCGMMEHIEQRESIFCDDEIDRMASNVLIKYSIVAPMA